MYSYIYLGIFMIGFIIMMSLMTSDSKKMDRTHWAIVLLLQFTNMGYFELSIAKSLDSAIIANTLIYLGGTILPTIFFVSLLQSLNIKVSTWIKHLLYSFAFVMFFCVRYGSQNGVFFKSADIEITAKGTLIHYEPGIMSKVHDIYIIILIGIIFFVLFYTRKTKRKSKIIINQGYLCIIVLMIIGYVINAKIAMNIEILPIVYMISLMVAGICFKMSNRYDVNEVVADMQETSALMHGYVLFMDDGTYWGASEKALEMIPELENIVHYNSGEDKEHLSQIGNVIRKMISDHKNSNKETEIIQYGDMFYSFEISDCNKLIFEKKRRLLFEITDVTAQQKYLEIVENYRVKLEEEVNKKTAHIEQINENLINAMADMVESRDPNTGGHIKRTSDAVRLLIEEMKKDSTYSGMESFFEKVVKAAPMHDLGKIAVDDAILRKPGKYEPWEYEIMKTHSETGAKIVDKILAKYDDNEFKQIARNVAHYHHERVDGSGYPKGLCGDEIPLEAKIMAIIDVYDALVSKRCYKEKFSFEKAYDIISDGMGTQFDMALMKYFKAVVPELEKYYRE